MEIQLFPERAPEEGSEDDEVKTLQSISETLIPSSGGGQIVAHNSSWFLVKAPFEKNRFVNVKF